MQRITVLAAIQLMAFCSPYATFNVARPAPLSNGDHEISSPNGEVKFLLLDREQELYYRVEFGTSSIIESSRTGIVVDGVDLGADTRIGEVHCDASLDRFPTRGVHAMAENRCIDIRNSPEEHVHSSSCRSGGSKPPSGRSSGSVRKPVSSTVRTASRSPG